jgi:hypothetical protein
MGSMAENAGEWNEFIIELKNFEVCALLLSTNNSRLGNATFEQTQFTSLV